MMTTELNLKDEQAAFCAAMRESFSGAIFPGDDADILAGYASRYTGWLMAKCAALGVPQHCTTCDGTGDVHRADGEWLGECHCVKDHRVALAAGDLMAVAEECGGLRIAENVTQVTKEDLARIVQFALQQDPVSVLDGWKLVPIDPTDAMQAAGAQSIRIETTAINKIWTGNKVFRAMIAAAPVPPLATPALNDAAWVKKADAARAEGFVGDDPVSPSADQEGISEWLRRRSTQDICCIPGRLAGEIADHIDDLSNDLDHMHQINAGEDY